MKRLVLVLVILWIGALAFPDVRERSEPRLAEVGVWVGDRMERPLSPITNRYRRVQAETQLSQASRLIVTRRNQGHRPPQSHELAEFLTRHTIAPGGLDPWGLAYRIVMEPDSVAVMSAGPDMMFGTEDDLVARVGFPGASRLRVSR